MKKELFKAPRRKRIISQSVAGESTKCWPKSVKRAN